MLSLSSYYKLARYGITLSIFVRNNNNYDNLFGTITWPYYCYKNTSQRTK